MDKTDQLAYTTLGRVSWAVQALKDGRITPEEAMRAVTRDMDRFHKEEVALRNKAMRDVEVAGIKVQQYNPEFFANRCPHCNNIVEGEDLKGDGVHTTFYCDECEKEVNPL